jgi:nucleotide-binding universal stress UspA family protein
MSENKSEGNLDANSVQSPFQQLLVGIDISNQTSELRLVAYLARNFNSHVTICNVTNIATSVKGDEVDGKPVTQEENKTHKAIEEMVHKEFGDYAKEVEIRILHGDPAERIVEYAEYCNSDLIVVGSRRQGALKKALLGSVSSSVVSRSKRSVLILKQ